MSKRTTCLSNLELIEFKKIPLTAKLDSAYGLFQFWLSLESFSSNYFQIGQKVVLLHNCYTKLNTLSGLVHAGERLRNL